MLAHQQSVGEAADVVVILLTCLCNYSHVRKLTFREMHAQHCAAAVLEAGQYVLAAQRLCCTHR